MCMNIYIYIYIYTHVYIYIYIYIYIMGPFKDPKGTNTKVTSAKGHFCVVLFPPGKTILIRRMSITYYDVVMFVLVRYKP